MGCAAGAGEGVDDLNAGLVGGIHDRDDDVESGFLIGTHLHDGVWILKFRGAQPLDELVGGHGLRVEKHLAVGRNGQHQALFAFDLLARLGLWQGDLDGRLAHEGRSDQQEDQQHHQDVDERDDDDRRGTVVFGVELHGKSKPGRRTTGC